MIYPLSNSSRQKRNGCLQQSSRKSSYNFDIGVGTMLKDSDQDSEEQKTANKNEKSKEEKKKNSNKSLQTSHTNRKPSRVFIIIIIESGATNLSSFSHGACLFPDVPRTKIS
jgi:hypothetical protein